MQAFFMHTQKKQDFSCPWSLLLELDNVFSLRASVSILDIEAYSLTFVKSLEAFTLNGRLMNENILSVITCNETIALFSVEPLYFSCSHLTLSPYLRETL